MSGVTPALFAEELLARLGMPQSENNVRALVALQYQEGGHANGATFNPINTMRDMPGSVNFKTKQRDAAPNQSVQAYQSWDDGIEAARRTLTNGLYNGILNALRRSAPPEETLREIAVSPFGWYEIKGGTRVPVAYPGALAIAKNDALFHKVALQAFSGGGRIGVLFGSRPRWLLFGVAAALGVVGVILVVAGSKRR